MVSPASALENLTLNVSQEIHVKAPLDVTFEALLEQLGPESTMSDGKPMSMKIELWPGGRWDRTKFICESRDRVPQSFILEIPFYPANLSAPKNWAGRKPARTKARHRLANEM